MPKTPPRVGFWEGLFTRQERMAILFFTGVSLAGVGLLGVKGLWGYSAFSAPAPRLQVQVNSASVLELNTLPGIGPKLAKRIVEDRARHGRFLTLSEVGRVKGITPKTLAKLKGYVRFDG